MALVGVMRRAEKVAEDIKVTLSAGVIVGVAALLLAAVALAVAIRR
jgi:hypothetical protein